MESIILASASPRRQNILKMLNIPFQVIIPDVDESDVDKSNLYKVPELLAVKKVKACFSIIPEERFVPWVLGADTLVLFNGKLFGKPESEQQAFDFLKELQGNTHDVITSVALYNGKTKEIATSTNITKVTFKSMSDEEINWYVKTGEWLGAAAGYRIQGVASCFINRIEGSMSCVVGLPISNLYDILTKQGYSILE